MKYALTFGAITVCSAFVGLKGIGEYVKRTGRQSIILVILTMVLTMALLSLPLKYLVLDVEKDLVVHKAGFSVTNSTTKAYVIPSYSFI